VAYDAARAPASARATRPAPAPLLSPNDDPVAGPIETRLDALQPGTPRVTAEQQLATISPPQVDPVDVSTGKPVCRERYTLHLVRPVRDLTPAAANTFTPGPYVLTVEFDGARPGHPLTRLALTPGPALRPLPPAPGMPPMPILP